MIRTHIIIAFSEAELKAQKEKFAELGWVATGPVYTRLEPKVVVAQLLINTNLPNG